MRRWITEKETTTPWDFNPKKMGTVVQAITPQEVDIHIIKAGDKYAVTHYEYARVFDGKVLKGPIFFDSLKKANKHIKQFVGFPTFRQLEVMQVVNYEAKDKSVSIYGTKYIIFERHKTCPYVGLNYNAAYKSAKKAIKKYMKEQ